MTERYVTTPEAAAELGVSESMLRTAARDGRLTPALKTPGGPRGGGHYRWDLEDLRRQLEKLRDGP